MSAPPTVAVRGEATLDVAPELATLTISVSAQAGDRRDALDLLSQRARAVAELVTRFESAVERSETSRLQVYPELSRNRTEKVKRYVGNCSTTLSVHDFTVLSDFIVAAGSIELASIDGPWWQLRPTSDVYRQARLAAVEDAVNRARDYAAAFGATITSLIEIADQGRSDVMLSGGGPMFASAAMGRGESSGADFDLQPPRQEVHGVVEARFQLSEPDLSRFTKAPS